jgi:phosphoserine aminotransferase
MGPAGTTLIVKEEILGKSGRSISSILDYEKHIKAESMYNTSSFFPVCIIIDIAMKNLGGVAAVEKLNNAKPIYYMLKSIEPFI